MLASSLPLPSSAWPRRAGGGLSPVRCSFCIAFLSFCFQVMTAAPAPFATNLTAPATNVPAPFAVSRAPPPPWVQRMQADDTNPNKRSVALWGGNQSDKYLITKNQWTLIVTDNGTVMGVHSGQKKPTFGVLEFLTLSMITTTTHVPHLLLTPKPNKPNKPNQPGQYGRVAIRGKKADRFVCMDSSGQVYSSPTFSDECEFQEQPLGNTHYAYYSIKYWGHRKQSKRRWYLGINRRGKMRLGYRTKHGRAFAQFMTMPVDERPHFRPGFSLGSSPRPPVVVRRTTTTTAPPAAATTMPHRRRHQNGRKKKTRRTECVSSGPFSRCPTNRGGSGGSNNGRKRGRKGQKRKNKKGKRKSRQRPRNGWGRRRKHRRRSERPLVPLLS